MPFLAPLFLLFALVAIPILVLYMLRLRRREMLVSSTMLWQRLMQDREANTPWQRLRRNLLLILQLLILALLVLALARPYLPVRSLVKGNVVVLLDGSASMLAEDVIPNRFSLAQDQVGRLIDDMAGNDEMTLILVAGSPRVLVSASSDKSELRQRSQEAQAKPQSADWPSALALAAGSVQGFEEAKIVIVSDGGLPAGLPAAPVEVIYIPIGESTENLAISNLSTRAGGTESQLLASVSNYGLLDRQVLLSIEVDNTLFDSRLIDVPANNTTNITWDLPEGSAVITARLADNEGDHFPLDDSAWTIHEGGLEMRALIVTEGNRFLDTVFSVLPGISVSRINPEGFDSEALSEPFDLYVFDGISVTESTPDADMLIIDPHPSTLTEATESGPIYSVTGVFTNTQVVRVVDSPILQFVDWGNVNVRQATWVDAPWAQPIVTAEGGPLLLAGERDGRRIVIIPFRLQDSDLPLQIAFPVLMANITGWLSPGRVVTSPMTQSTGVNTGYAPGEPVTLLVNPGATDVRVRKPDGTTWTTEVGRGPLSYVETNQSGVYEVFVQTSNGTQLVDYFVVGLADSAESNIAPVESLAIGHTFVDTVGEENIGQREIWSWLAILAISVLLIEWWIYYRGAQLPSLSYWKDRLGRREAK